MRTNVENRASSKFLDEVESFKSGLVKVFDMGGKNALNKKENVKVSEFINDQV